MKMREYRTRTARKPAPDEIPIDRRAVIPVVLAAIPALAAAIAFGEQLPLWSRMGMLIAVNLLALFTFLNQYLQALAAEGAGTPAGDKPRPPDAGTSGCGGNGPAA